VRGDDGGGHGAELGNERRQPEGRRGKPTPHAAKAAKEPADGLTRLDATSLRQAMRKAKGGDLFIHLWASWCGPCLKELPNIDRLARQARARGATFLSVSIDDPTRSIRARFTAFRYSI
jgi:thiol-disulfide isomerase/thioredoxin